MYLFHRNAEDEIKNLKMQVEDLGHDLRAKLHQIQSLEEAVSKHRMAADYAVLEIQRMANSQKSQGEREQELRFELGEAGNEISLLKERATNLESKLSQQGLELKQVSEARTLSDTELTATKV